MDELICGLIRVGPDGRGSYRYGIETEQGLIVSEHGYHNAESARFDSRRIQRVTKRGTLVPDVRWNPDLN